MLQAILVTEFERAIINAIRAGCTARRGAVLLSLEFPETKEIQELFDSIVDEDKFLSSLEKKKRKIENRKRNERLLKIYREAGYREPLEFGTEKAVPFIRSLPYGK